MGALAVAGLYMGSQGFTTAFAYGAASLLGQHFFGRQQVVGPRLTDLSLQGSELDIPIPKVYGKARLAGNIVWSTGIKEKKREESAKGGGMDMISYTYHTSLAVMLCLGPIARPLKIWFGTKIIYDWNNGDQKGAKFEYDAANGCYVADTGVRGYDKIWVYRGTEEQMPNGMIENELGVGQTPAFRGRVVLVVEDMKLEEFGNQIPPITVLLENCTTNARDIAVDISKRAGLTPAQHCDYRELGDEFNEGFILKDQQPARSFLGQLGTRHGCEFPERDGRIMAIKYGKSSCLTIPEKDLRYHEEGAEVPSTEWQRAQEADLPYSIQVQYLDKNRNFTPNAQRAHRQVTTSENKETVALSMTMSGAQSRAIAERELYRKWMERSGPEVQLAWKYLWLAAADTITIPTVSGERDVRLKGGQVPFFGPLVYRAVLTNNRLSGWPEGEEITPPDYPDVTETGEVVAVVIESNSVKDSYNGYPHVYLAASVSKDSGWDGVTAVPAEVGESTALPTAARMGDAVTALADHFDADWWDEDSTLFVDLLRGSLETVTEIELLNGANSAWLKSGDSWELIQFQNVQSLGEVGGKNRYMLSRFLRGRRGTESFMAGHAVGDTFVFLDSAAVQVDLPTSAVGMLTTWRFYGGLEEEEVEQPIEGDALMPYAPADVAGERVADDLEITWVRRSRYRGAAFNDPELGESVEEYEVDILDGETVVRTIDSLSTPEATYLASEQMTDFGSVQSSVDVRIYQVSSVVGRGYAAEATV